MDDLNQGLEIGSHVVSGTWKYLFPEEFEYFKFPEEIKSTCSSCPKVCSDGFHPDYRCCTYHPRIPNFLLGLALEDEQTKGHVIKLIEEGYATPEGMQHTPKQYFASINQNVQKNFGKDAEVLCRFLDQKNGMCQMYIYRNSVCSTFFCESDYPEEGVEFWERLQSVAGQLETALSQWCMDNLGLGSEKYFSRYNGLSDKQDQCSSESTQAWSEMALKELWGDKFSHEKQIDFFLECARLVRENKEKLFELCSAVEIRDPHVFEKAFAMSLPEAHRKEMESEGLSTGTPVPLEDLWYLLQKAQRNLRMKMSTGS